MAGYVFAAIVLLAVLFAIFVCAQLFGQILELRRKEKAQLEMLRSASKYYLRKMDRDLETEKQKGGEA